MSYLPVVAAVIVTLTVQARMASAQTPPTPTVSVGEFFRELYAPVTRDVQANGGPPLSPRRYGGAVVLSNLLVAKMTNLPTANGGLTWTYDSALGTWSRAVDSFGSQIGERSETIGRRKVNFGFAYQRFTFDRLNGQSLSAAAIESRGELSAGASSLILDERVSLSRADVSFKTVFLNYGVTSRIDVGVFMPFVSLALDGSLEYTLRRAGSNAILSQRTNAVVARAEGVGDPVFRAKWNVLRRSAGGLAVASDWRFHYGAFNEALAGMKLQVIASGNTPAVNTHLNVGFSGFICRGDDLDNLCGDVFGFFVAGGIDKAVTNRLTLATDIQTQRENKPFLLRQNIATIPTNAMQGMDIVKLAERADSVTVAMTGKINVWGNLLVTVTGLVPVNSSGLTDRFTPIIGIDYAW